MIEFCGALRVLHCAEFVAICDRKGSESPTFHLDCRGRLAAILSDDDKVNCGHRLTIMCCNVNVDTQAVTLGMDTYDVLLPVSASPSFYRTQALRLFDEWSAGALDASAFVRAHHPFYRHPVYRWTTAATAAELPPTLADAELALARRYQFGDFEAMLAWASEASTAASPAAAFEEAADAIVSGDIPSLQRILAAKPDIIRARSTRVTPHDPAQHGATLLHYTAANGVESYRLRVPPNAVAVLQLLLDSGADPNATAGFYGTRWNTLGLLVSSSSVAESKLQLQLAHMLLDRGARDGTTANAGLPVVVIALLHDCADTGIALAVRRDIVSTDLLSSAGLGDTAAVATLLRAATEGMQRFSFDFVHKAFVLACMGGHTTVVEQLLAYDHAQRVTSCEHGWAAESASNDDGGTMAARFNPAGFHAHCTALHLAAARGHLDVVRILLKSAPNTAAAQDLIYESTPAGWAHFHGHADIGQAIENSSLATLSEAAGSSSRAADSTTEL